MLTSIRNVAHQRYLYSPQDEAGKRLWDLESKFADYEGLMQQVWQRLADDMVDLYEPAMRKGLALFISLLYLRHPRRLAEVDRLHGRLVEMFESSPKNALGNPDIEAVEINGQGRGLDNTDWLRYRDASENDKKRWFVESVQTNAIHLAEVLMKKRWSVIFAADSVFITTDTPVLLMHQSREVFGVGTPGVIVSFPLSPTRVLMMDDRHDQPAGHYYPLTGSPADHNGLAWGDCERFMISPRHPDFIRRELLHSSVSPTALARCKDRSVRQMVAPKMLNPSHARLGFEQYREAAEALHVLAGMLLFEFARHADREVRRDQMARNLIARADTMVHSIVRLWETHDRADCWILHRALLDRLFHLYALNQKNQFDVFDDWSFKALYEAAGRLRSDPAIEGKLEGLVENLTEDQKARYHRLVKNPPEWRRPKAEDVSKAMGLAILYRYGYDYASRHVHPMANDGQEDFFNITGLQPRPDFGEAASIVVLSNSVLVASLILQEALNASALAWSAVVYDAVEGLRKFLICAAPEEHVPIVKVSAMFAAKTPLAARCKAPPPEQG
jgi:hypothetical protein